ncbi:uncharacterized protein LOC6597431 [Drosophila persimilis]|uniref:uncharacterized protein LOC6597431 n=1 Tax=Drosophila persimilis TaxID=7234 RepID=UPI000F076383|nr:uncharacterized protein LOC6597431 [Drosophila persimilis]
MVDGQEQDGAGPAGPKPGRRVQFSSDTKPGDGEEAAQPSGSRSRSASPGLGAGVHSTPGLDFGEQMLPSTLAVGSQLWHASARRLDLRYLNQELPSPKDQLLFLGDMQKSFKCVVFDVDRLADNLKALETAEVGDLSSVQECHLMSKDTDPATGAQGDTAQTSSCRVTFSEWPMHSLPKLMVNLRRLHLYCNVQVHFIERFANLELLALYGSISQSAITGVFERCRQLERLSIKAECDARLDLSGVAKCPFVNGISVPVSIFANQRDLLISRPHQQLIELTQCGRNSSLAVDCLRSIVALKGDSIEAIQMDCGWLGNGAQSLATMAMGRCTRLDRLVLGNCDFGHMAIGSLDLPRAQRHIALNRCHNLTDSHIQDIVQRCPAIHELSLIEGPLLTGALLHNVYRARAEMAVGHPLSLVLTNCKSLLAAYKTVFAEYWEPRRDILKIEFVEDESTPLEDVQVFFHGPSLDQGSSEAADPQIPQIPQMPPDA